MRFTVKSRRPLIPMSEPAVAAPAVVSSEPGLSICITALNDNEELPHTIQSIRDTAGDRVEIVVVDDHSDTPPDAKGADIVIRNPSRAGVAKSRDIAASAATKEFIMLTDAHMRFDPAWLGNLNQRIGNPLQAWCGQCVGLHAGDMVMTPKHGNYHGARMVFLEKENTPTPTIFEGKWAKQQDDDDYEVSCFMGASYIIQRKFYFAVGGLAALKHWGSDEPYLSTKIYLAGGSIRLCKSVRIGHQFRAVAPYKSNAWCLIYNKLRAMRELLDERTYTYMLGLFRPTNNLSTAARQLQADISQVNADRERNGQLFKRDIRWFCDKFHLNNPIDAALRTPKRL